MRILDTIEKKEGLYTIQEAALFSRIYPSTLNRWLYGNKASRALRTSRIHETEGKFITFLEFVEALAIRNLRGHHNIPLQKIREAIEEAKIHYDIDYPFATRGHKTYISGKELYIVFKDGDPIGLTGKEKKQKIFKECLEPYMEDLSFDKNGVACQYTAFQDGKNIIHMTPDCLFGAPVVEGCGYSAETLWNAAKDEGSVEKAAEYYEVDIQTVLTCCRYWDSLLNAKAA